MENGHQVHTPIEIETFNQLYLNINRAYYFFRHITDKLGVSFDQFMILHFVIEKKQATPTVLRKLLDCSSVSVSRKINGLKDKGLIEKQRIDDTDQRIVTIQPTVEGNRIYQKARAIYVNSCHENITNKFSKSQLDLLQELLALLASDSLVVNEYDN